MNIAQHRTDKTAAEDGKWFEYDGSRFLIAAHGNPRFQRAIMRAGKKNRAALAREDIAVVNGMTTQVMAETILLDWEGVKDGPADYAYSITNAVKLLNDAADFRKWVEEQAMNLSNFIVEMEGADMAALKSGGAVGAPVGEA